MNRQTVLDTLKTYKSEIERLGFSKIGLFGSFAKGTQTPYSDIDIAIGKDRSTFSSAYDYFNKRHKLQELLRQKLHHKIDIFDLDSSSDIKPFIEKEIIYV